MRLCIPTTDDKGRHAELCDHFGSAPYLTIYDSKTGAYEIVDNSDHEHEHGTCHPMDNLRSKSIDCVVCRGLGRRALEKLHSGRIRVLRTDRSTVEEIVQNFSIDELSEIDAESACQNHKCH